VLRNETTKDLIEVTSFNSQ